MRLKVQKWWWAGHGVVGLPGKQKEGRGRRQGQAEGFRADVDNFRVRGWMAGLVASSL